MICRKCPSCGAVWYSASTDKWPCESCGKMLYRRHDVDLELAKEKE